MRSKKSIVIFFMVSLIVCSFITIISYAFLRNREICFVSIYSDGVKLDTISVTKGEDLNNLNAPVKEGYEFKGFFIDKKCTKPLDKSKKIERDTDIYLKFVKLPEGDKVIDVDSSDKKDEKIRILFVELTDSISDKEYLIDYYYLSGDKFDIDVISNKLNKALNESNKYKFYVNDNNSYNEIKKGYVIDSTKFYDEKTCKIYYSIIFD